MAQTFATDIKKELISVIDELPIDQKAEVLNFARFIRVQKLRQPEEPYPPVQRLEDLWGDFWPEDQQVDDFINAVRHWRHEDIVLHRDLQ